MSEEELLKHATNRLRRLEHNHYALKNAHHRLKMAIDLNHNQEIYASTGELLLWVLTTNEWHLKHDTSFRSRRNKSDNGQILFGLLHAYNSMKHNMDFISIHQIEGGFSFPLEFPLEIKPITVHWTVAGELLKGDRPGQKQNYEKYIEGEEVLSTFEIAIEFLRNEYEFLKANH